MEKKIIYLENDFTTVEQSLQLLKMGLPAESANLRYAERYGSISAFPYFVKNPAKHYQKGSYTRFIPCWTVGRLQKILKTCWIETADEQFIIFAEIDTMVTHFCECIACGLIDLSKLDV